MRDQTAEQVVATEILRQLGGLHFLLMTGAKQLHTLSEGRGGLRMHINSVNYDRKRVTRVSVVLDWDDTYTVTSSFVRAGKLTVVATDSDVYCDMLQDVFERQTGMLTTLFPRRG